MTPDPLHPARVTEAGALAMDDPARFKRSLIRHAGKRVEVIVRRVRVKRSSPQNKYLHAIVIPVLAEFCGYDLDAMKDALKWKFLRKPADVVGAPDTVRHTSDLTTAEFAEFLDAVIAFAATDLGVTIPSPHEVDLAS